MATSDPSDAELQQIVGNAPGVGTLDEWLALYKAGAASVTARHARIVKAAAWALRQLEAANESVGEEFLDEEELAEAKAVAAELAEALAAGGIDPEPLVLHCPKCEKLHIDRLEPDGTDWSKRPHKTHLCKNTPDGPNTGCGHLWRPKETPTVGVACPPPVTLIELIADEVAEYDGSVYGQTIPARGARSIARQILLLVTGRLTAQLSDDERARLQLGSWLSEAPFRAWSSFGPDSKSDRYGGLWTIKLTERGTDVGIADKPTWAEAVTAALAQAAQLERESNANRID